MDIPSLRWEDAASSKGTGGASGAGNAPLVAGAGGGAPGSRAKATAASSSGASHHHQHQHQQHAHQQQQQTQHPHQLPLSSPKAEDGGAGGEVGDWGPSSPGGTHLVLQAVRGQLQMWASKKLTQLHPDASSVLVHFQLLEEAKKAGTPQKMRRVWWRLPLGDELPALTGRLAAALFHLSPSREAAWLTLLRTFGHGLAVPMGAAAEAGM